jgi:hypothetical protein
MEVVVMVQMVKTISIIEFEKSKVFLLNMFYYY